MNYDDDQEMQSIIKDMTLNMDRLIPKKTYIYRDKYKIQMSGDKMTHIVGNDNAVMVSDIYYIFFVEKIEDNLSHGECNNIAKYIKEKTDKHNPFVSGYKKKLRQK